MKKFLPIQFKFNTSGFLKLSLLTLFVSLLLGGYSQANAQSAPKDEVISVPPQEAFFIQEKTHTTSGGDDSRSQHSNTLGNSAALPHMSNNWKNDQNLVKKANSGTQSRYIPR